MPIPPRLTCSASVSELLAAANLQEHLLSAAGVLVVSDIPPDPIITPGLIIPNGVRWFNPADGQTYTRYGDVWVGSVPMPPPLPGDIEP